ncbi:MAG: hypothetical protein WBA97_27220 [Actinophytocola sp.]|uniref:hypothetical protein n=1 Tax=Actinophytocola sp. TaxID=1872138 RepID=UPI003C77453F
MFRLQKIAATTLVTLAAAAGLLVVAGPIAALGQDNAVNSEVSVLADSPWDAPKP